MKRGQIAVSLLLLLAACAPQRASNPSISASGTHAGILKLADWNFEFLAEKDMSGCRPRTARDYERIRQAVTSIDADVFAFEEVENEAAAARVFDTAKYMIIMERRPGNPTGSCGRDNPAQRFVRQAVGFAIKKTIPFTRSADLIALQLGNPNLRSGVEVVLHPAKGEALRLLVVHLKSGCFQGDVGKACPEILRQMPVIKAWVQAATAAGTRFAILGDWNRRLALPEDIFWKPVDAQNPADADLTLTDAGVKPRCDPRYHDFIDHIVLDKRAGAQFTNFVETTFATDANPSDHCPISITLPR